MKKFFLFAAAAMLALVGCEKQNQSSLDFGDVNKSAKISGTLVYFADKAGTATVETPVAGQRIYFLVAANKYAENAGGNQQFEATTKEDGSFEIVVPTGSKSIDGKLLTDVIALGEGADRIFLEKTEKELTLNANDAKVEKRIAAIDQVLTACQGTAVLQGKINYDAGYVKKDGNYEKGLVAVPAGLKVAIEVPYDDHARTFYAETKADGTYSYNVPVPAAATKKAKVTIAQFQAKYTDYLNNELLSKDALFELAIAKEPSLKDGETTICDITATKVDGSEIEPTTKTTKIKVKGELTVDAEVFTYSTKTDEEKKITGVDYGTKKYTNEINGGKFQLVVNHKVAGKVESSIIYDLAIKGDDGKYETEVAIYDGWDFNDVEIYVKVNPFVVSNYAHYSYRPEFKKDGSWESCTADKWVDWTDKDNYKNNYDTQDCEGKYEYDGIKAAKTYDGFFPVTLDATLTFTMSGDAIKALRGRDDADIDYKTESGTKHHIYAGGLAYPKP